MRREPVNGRDDLTGSCPLPETPKPANLAVTGLRDGKAPSHSHGAPRISVPWVLRRHRLGRRHRSWRVDAAGLLGSDRRSGWWEFGEQVGRVHLEEFHRLVQAVKPPGAKGPEAHLVRE